MIFLSLIQEPFLLVVWVVAIFIILTVHEFAHALAATWQGDMTAKNEGRLTLNPFAHISWVGFMALLLVGFGWGRPVPFNPYNLRNQRYGQAIVAVAGPLANFLLAIIGIICLKLLFNFTGISDNNLLFQFLNLIISLNIILMLFNLLPFPPLDGSKILFTFLSGVKYDRIREVLETQGTYVLFFIIILDNFSGLNFLSHFYKFILNGVYSLFF